MGSNVRPRYKFETVTGFFMQAEPDTPENFDYVQFHAFMVRSVDDIDQFVGET